MKARKIKFIARACRWFDKVNGNTYHSVRITKVSTGETIYCQFQYGYGDQYRWTALLAMYGRKWIDNKKYMKDPNNRTDPRPLFSRWESDNNYPIEWIVNDGLKRDCVTNGKE